MPGSAIEPARRVTAVVRPQWAPRAMPACPSCRPIHRPSYVLGPRFSTGSRPAQNRISPSPFASIDSPGGERAGVSVPSLNVRRSRPSHYVLSSYFACPNTAVAWTPASVIIPIAKLSKEKQASAAVTRCSATHSKRRKDSDSFPISLSTRSTRTATRIPVGTN